MTEQFWTDERRAALKDATHHVVRVRKLHINSLTVDVNARLSRRDHILDRTLYYFLSDKTLNKARPSKPRNMAFLGALLEVVLLKFAALDGPEKVACQELVEEWRKVAPEADGEDEVGSATPGISAGLVVKVLHSLTKALRMDENAFSTITNELMTSSWATDKPNKTGEGTHRERYFLCYRYHRSAGQILKSHLALIGGAPGSGGACTFVGHADYSRDGSRRRRSAGLVFPMKRMISLVGQVNNGEGMTFFALPTLGDDKHNFGLCTTLDASTVPVTARILLVPTTHDSDAKAGIGLFKPEDLEAEERGYMDYIKNEIEFSFIRDVFQNGEPVKQADMVRNVASLLSLEGAPIFAYDGDPNAPFNPADTKEYTFNAPLRVYQDAP